MAQLYFLVELTQGFNWLQIVAYRLIGTRKRSKGLIPFNEIRGTNSNTNSLVNLQTGNSKESVGLPGICYFQLEIWPFHLIWRAFPHHLVYFFGMIEPGLTDFVQFLQYETSDYGHKFRYQT